MKRDFRRTGVYILRMCHRDSQIRTVDIHAGDTASDSHPSDPTAPPFWCKAMAMTSNM